MRRVFAFALLAAADPGDLNLRPPQPPYSNERAELLSTIPPLAAAAIVRAASHPDLGLTLLRLMAAPELSPVGVLSQIFDLVGNRLNRAASADLWLAVAEFAAAHGAHEDSARAFAEAAPISPDAGRWLARAALETAAAGDPDRARTILVSAKHAATSEDQATFVEVMAAAVDEDPERIIDAASRHVGVDALVEVMRARALSLLGRVDEAANAAMNAVRDHPNRSMVGGLVLEAARQLLSRSEEEGVGRSRLQYADQARQLALEVRDWRRQWRGPSEDAAAMAAQAAAAARDFGAVVRLASPPPDGEATEREMNHQELIVMASNAAVIAGWSDQARTLAQRISSIAERRLVEARCADIDGAAKESVRLLKEALQHSANDGQRARPTWLLRVPASGHLRDLTNLKHVILNSGP